MKRSRFWILGVVLSAVHLGAVFYCIMASFGATMSAFDQPGLPPQSAAVFLGKLADVLMLPVSILWNAVHLKNASSMLEWVAMVANSCIWGFALASLIYLAARLRRLDRRSRGAKP